MAGLIAVFICAVASLLGSIGEEEGLEQAGMSALAVIIQKAVRLGELDDHDVRRELELRIYGDLEGKQKRKEKNGGRGEKLSLDSFMRGAREGVALPFGNCSGI